MPRPHAPAATYDSLELDHLVALGHTTDRAVRILVRLPGPGRCVLELWPQAAPAALRRQQIEIDDAAADHTAAFTYPDDFPGEPDLVANTRYEGALRRASDGSVVDTLAFETAPSGSADAPDAFSFLLLSCHQPFADSGEVSPGAARMMHVLNATAARPGVKRALLLGDQIYADAPPALSLFAPDHFARVAPSGRDDLLDCSRQEIRRLYHQRYRRFWAVPGFASFQSRLPSYPILDDHEIADNWGSLAEHATPAWTTLRDGALDAYHDYQAARVLRARPACFDHGFRHGPVAIYLLDVRTQRRREDGRTALFAAGQLRALCDFLAAHGDAAVLLVVLSVPVLHVGEWATALLARLPGFAEDAADRWSSAASRADRDRLLRAIRDHQRAHPRTQVVLVSGDIHIGSALRLDWTDEPLALHQVTASSLSNQASPLRRLLETAAPLSVRAIRGDDLRAQVGLAGGAGSNPYGGLNVGLLHLRRQRGSSAAERFEVEFELVGDDGGAEPEPSTVLRVPLVSP